MKSTVEKIPVGWREWVGLPGLGVDRIKAKLDTGARTSALDVIGYKIINENDTQIAEFDIRYGTPKHRKTKRCKAPVADLRTVRDSGGHEEERIVIKTDVKIGETVKNIEMTLTCRSGMKFRMLLGRSAMQGFVVDPEKSYLTGKNKSTV